MPKEYLGTAAVVDLFDIINDNYVYKKDFEERDKSLTNAINVGSALIAASLLKVAEAISGVGGGGGISGSTFLTVEQILDITDDFLLEAVGQDSDISDEAIRNAVASLYSNSETNQTSSLVTNTDDDLLTIEQVKQIIRDYVNSKLGQDSDISDDEIRNAIVALHSGETIQFSTDDVDTFNVVSGKIKITVEQVKQIVREVLMERFTLDTDIADSDITVAIAALHSDVTLSATTI